MQPTTRFMEAQCLYNMELNAQIPRLKLIVNLWTNHGFIPKYYF